MGSIEKACISGFLCRLCSEMHRTVIHIYGDHGQRLCLVEKINGYLPITISPTDPLPKTICRTCLYRVEQHYSLLMRLTRMREERRLKIQKDADTCSISSAEYSDEEEPVSTKSHAEKKDIKSTTKRSTSEPASSNKSQASIQTNQNSVESNVAGSSNRLVSQAVTGTASRNSATRRTSVELSPMT
ncbi:uncharacterized protein LOC115621368 [Scaptodrosophila lebanonensis]|uniref:Uncharacterized protein LOC115621368 n=1 Tax=Drosophila lebanonensis TaxID=7225 RepID=A0A6J2T6W1_DROLE|nr:uncharacterized protein LOC115621368 [Scaptodrosophila lebanonensis]XP_030370852.1 uncharacterized protein LOC115621368 [Scaptodrosophila lebanonensis]XP_030370853.1 uncharacterized protein LOC115621368 [Scaptodrosophila lebanonensis]